MKILKAKKYIDNIDIPLLEFKVDDIMIIPSLKWLNKRMENFTKSIEKNGMLWPIIVTDLEHYWQKDKNWPKDENGNFKKGISVHTGNKRVLYAKINSYDLIEGYFVKSKEEKNMILSKTFISKESWPI
jgi:hypothetical protein